MGLNIFGHNTENVLFIDIESDDLSAVFNPECRVYLVGVMDYQGVWCTYSSVEAFIGSYHGPGNGWMYVFHNASFDVPALRLRGAYITDYFDTMVASHTLTPESAEYHSLGSLVPAVKKSLRELLTEEGYDMKKVPKGQEYTWYGQGIVDGIDSLVMRYLHGDLLATRELYTRLEREYTTVRPETLTLLKEVNLPYIERIIEYEQGCYVHYDESVTNVLSEAAERSYNACLRIVGWRHTGDRFAGRRKGVVWGDQCLIEPFNPNSHQQVSYALTRLYGWEPMKRTVSGAISTSAEVLETLDYPLVEHLLAYAKNTKLLSFTGAIRTASADTGILRPSYNQCATRTTRLSSSNPNIQQIPSRDPVGKQLRRLFVAPEGYKLVVGDQGGFQLRIAAAYMAYYFDDYRLAECFNRGEDVHQFFADVYGIPRKISKNVTFGYMFGAGVNKMTATANRGNPNPIQSHVIRGALDSLETNMPALPGLKDLFVDHAKSNGGIIHDWLGQRYVIPELFSRDKGIRASGERKVFNYMIQGMEATMFRHLQNKASVVAKQFMALPAFVVHDEVGYYVPTPLVSEACSALGKVYTVPFSLYAPEPHNVAGLHTECTFNPGTSWYDAKD